MLLFWLLRNWDSLFLWIKKWFFHRNWQWFLVSFFKQQRKSFHWDSSSLKKRLYLYSNYQSTEYYSNVFQKFLQFPAIDCLPWYSTNHFPECLLLCPCTFRVSFLSIESKSRSLQQAECHVVDKVSKRTSSCSSSQICYAVCLCHFILFSVIMTSILLLLLLSSV